MHFFWGLIGVAIYLGGPGQVFASLPPQIVFIGGQGSTEQNMQEWQLRAYQNSKFGGRFQFRGLALPSSHSAQNAVIANGRQVIEKLVAEIDSSPEGSQYILVGHSSGSAISNQVARLIKSKVKVRLIVLDGFVPRGVPREVPTVCWSATDAGSGRTSPNTRGMNACFQRRVFRPIGCASPMCLHFALVNSSAPQLGLDSDNYQQLGYAQLSPNLEWLDEFVPRSPKSQSGVAR